MIDGKFKINPDEAPRVCAIYRMYVKHGIVTALVSTDLPTHILSVYARSSADTIGADRPQVDGGRCTRLKPQSWLDWVWVRGSLRKSNRMLRRGGRARFSSMQLQEGCELKRSSRLMAGLVMKLKQLLSTERQGGASPALVIAELNFVHTGGSRSRIVPTWPRRTLWSLLFSSKATAESS